MKIDNRAKLIIDIENNYLFDNKDLVVVLNDKRRFRYFK
ncbi:hypothetical protein ALNOE001_04220 [Candidatus Methanobinarius endosymbioticus]|uniref:Uncharacterized protein n=1 Tax=Candidatus Methanobinarius endosymbioticus TaxID=2006182 RepID=A0A366MDB7_9EURY|nr:hypothetical protein ALNOE001_04220 [Candidatus Methanobinarius endosymbioticus]